ncbi:unnamed protein product [Chrysodeixis includens]|uniref:WW domain-binding protein 4 n=1 Tax=Chrysodeixis includens TaxID=689277 RepID=A0A9P0FS82_CHRIL|nr:unnamed protein product [Chrysodeixis includens]
MTEYWKSQARKYCEFCKCWFADNKVSISFHENGKRHKENVQKHISTLSKKSAKEFKQKEKIDDDIKKMEAAAMAAYLKDVQNNADLTSQSINEMINQSGGSNETTLVVATTPAKKAVWNEVKSEDGSSYFWNTVTNETSWDTPDEYVSIADQEKSKLKEESKDKKNKKIKKQQQKQAQEEVNKEVNAHLAREKMRELAVNKDPPPPKRMIDYGPPPRAVKPYGSWTPVITQPTEAVDLQLPKGKELPPPPVIMEPEVIQFKEKRVQSLGDEPVEFKKRKINNPKRNMRQKLDDD